MRHSKGFVLADILISMIIQAGFIVVLCSSFYLLVSFESNTQQVLTARVRGQRVIQYIDQRIRTAGLGFQNCTYPLTNSDNRPCDSKAVRKALDCLVENGNPLYNSTHNGLRLPVALSYANKDNPTSTDLVSANAFSTYRNSENYNIQKGNILTLLYAERNTELDVNFVIAVDKTPVSSQDVIFTMPDWDNPLGITSNCDDDWAKNFIGYLGIDFIKNSIAINKNSDWLKKDNTNAIKDRYQNTNRNKRHNSVSAGLFTILVNQYYSTLTDESKWKILWEKIRIIREKISDYGCSDRLLDLSIDYTYTYKFISGQNEIEKSNSNFNKLKKSPTETNEKYLEKRKKRIDSWSVMAGTGIPLFVSSFDQDVVNLECFTIAPTDKIKTGDEILYLKCQRMFVNGTLPDRNFVFQELTDEWDGPNYFQDGILEIYFELHVDNNDTEKNILDLWVLSSGGNDGKTHDKPASWPSKARWNNNYQYHVLHVSRASWKLNNIPKRFDWYKE